MDKNNNEMAIDLKRSATIIELVSSVFIILSVVVSAYVSISVTQGRQDERLKNLESNYHDISLDLKEINQGQRELSNKIVQLMLELKDKQDRTNK